MAKTYRIMKTKREIMEQIRMVQGEIEKELYSERTEGYLEALQWVVGEE